MAMSNIDLKLRAFGYCYIGTVPQGHPYVYKGHVIQPSALPAGHTN